MRAFFDLQRSEYAPNRIQSCEFDHGILIIFKTRQLKLFSIASIKFTMIHTE